MQLGYRPGKDYWNHGYYTEAARALVKYGFEAPGLHRIFSRHFTGNPVPGWLLQKIGMRHEASLQEIGQVRKPGMIRHLEERIQ